MEGVDAIKALEKAARDLPTDRQPIHHSDRGCQYCSHEYVGVLQGGRPSGRTLQHAPAVLVAEAELPGKNPRRRSRKGLLTQANHPTKQQTTRVNLK
jgi:transposase InsO family protein